MKSLLFLALSFMAFRATAVEKINCDSTIKLKTKMTSRGNVVNDRIWYGKKLDLPQNTFNKLDLGPTAKDENAEYVLEVQMDDDVKTTPKLIGKVVNSVAGDLVKSNKSVVMMTLKSAKDPSKTIREVTKYDQVDYADGFRSDGSPEVNLGSLVEQTMKQVFKGICLPKSEGSASKATASPTTAPSDSSLKGAQ